MLPSALCSALTTSITQFQKVILGPLPTLGYWLHRYVLPCWSCGRTVESFSQCTSIYLLYSCLKPENRISHKRKSRGGSTFQCYRSSPSTFSRSRRHLHLYHNSPSSNFCRNIVKRLSGLSVVLRNHICATNPRLEKRFGHLLLFSCLRAYLVLLGYFTWFDAVYESRIIRMGRPRRAGGCNTSARKRRSERKHTRLVW